MSMRGASRRAADAIPVSVAAFAWDAATVATLRHVSLPWTDPFEDTVMLAAAPLASLGDIGVRDRLSLLAQFVAHQAFLQFAGIADTDFEISEWAVIRKRGADVRLIRVAAREADPECAPPVVAIAHEFANAVGCPALTTLKRAWARAETIYAEIDERFNADAVADRTWMRGAAYGRILAPGSESLRLLWTQSTGEQTFNDPSIVDALRAHAVRDRTATLVVIGGGVALQRFAALVAFDPFVAGSEKSEAEVAEHIAAKIAESRHVIVVQAPAMLDGSSRRVIELLKTLTPATWLIHTAETPTLQSQRQFVLSPRLASMRPLVERATSEALQQFVLSDAFARYLSDGELPADDRVFATIAEPRRSYIAALALLGTRISRDLAARFLRDVLFDQRLDDLVVPGLTALTGDEFSFESDEARQSCVQHVPVASRPALCRAAAALTSGTQAALLLIDGGDAAQGLALLEGVDFETPEIAARALSRIAQGTTLTPVLSEKLAFALYECGRFDQARTAAATLQPDRRELLLALIERREGNYASALARLERTPSIFETSLLRAEVLRLLGRYRDAQNALTAAEPRSNEQTFAREYETAVLAIDMGVEPGNGLIPRHHYLGARLDTYEALDRDDYSEASRCAQRALTLARTTLERIDAWLDRVFASFSSGAWSETRAIAIDALTVADQAHGDRAAAGILYTLAYLAADDARWQPATYLVDRLRQHFSDDPDRTFELSLLTAHIAFGRGRFNDAIRDATAVLARPRVVRQIREAAALIIDEIEWRKGKSTGQSGNRELDDRHRRIGLNEPPRNHSRAEQLRAYRAAIRAEDYEAAAKIARDLDLELPASRQATSAADAEILRKTALAEWPIPATTFDPLSWCFAVRNRLGHWSSDGSLTFSQPELDAALADEHGDWIRCGDRELLFLEGSRTWPPQSRRAVAALFQTKAENSRLRRALDANESDVRPPSMTHGIVGESAAIRAVFDLIDRVAKRDVAACILGESGTGKELVARAIHRASPRHRKPFTAINCAALPENLIESELFGQVRGAFTGADRDRAGLIEASDGGTVFLDEIGEMPLTAQAKLLRFLQDGDFRRVGDVAARTADVRIVSATNRKLETAVEEGRFREDLYYRIRGVEITLPALRDRGMDVILLARHFLAIERAQHRSGPSALSPEVEMLFRSYRWPGNVRELQNTIRGAHAMAGDTREVEMHHLPERLRNTLPSRVVAGSYQDAVTRFRRELIEKSLLAASGNQNKAAAMLNMSRQALAYQIRELGILVREMPRM